MAQEKSWVYKNLLVKEGLKPNNKHLQYFFVISEGGEKKCNYCVWIDDEAFSRFAPSENFEEIISSQREEWSKWVQGKIDQGDFNNVILKIEKTGQKEISLNEMEEKLSFE